MRSPPARGPVVFPGGALGLGVAYVALYVGGALWGRQFVGGGDVTPWYPPPGVTAALIVGFGIRWVPLVPLAELLTAIAVFRVDRDFSVLQIAVNTLAISAAYVAGPVLFRGAIGGNPGLRRWRDVLAFVGTCAVLSPLLAALAGTGVLDWAGQVQDGKLFATLRSWFIGDAVGVLTAGPFLLLVLHERRGLLRGLRNPRALVQAACLIAVPALAGALDSSGIPELAYLSLLPLIWAAVTDGIAGAILGVVAINVTMAIGASGGSPLDADLDALQGLCAVIAVTGLALGAAVSERRRAESVLAFRAAHDPLTGLPNRASFLDWLGHAERKSGEGSTAVVLLDLDRFRALNELRGHDVADRVLRLVGRRFAHAAGTEGRCARLGVDEFAVLAEDDGSGLDARGLAARLAGALDEPIVLGGESFRMSASAGVAVAGPGLRADELIGAADLALQAARRSGQGGLVVIDPALNAAAHARHRLDEDLRAATENNQLWLAFQPILDFADPVVRRWEALLRWDHVSGPIAPVDILAAAERTGQLERLGAWVADEACRILAAHGSAGAVVCVNVAARELLADGFVDRMVETVERHGLRASALEVELTEHALLDDLDRADVVLRSLRSHGFRVAVDDFGTGYSSLTYLERLSVDTVKLDRAFVARLGKSDRADAIVASVVRLARALDMRVVAEGVEHEEQLAAVSALGCDAAQGFLVGIPAPLRQAEASSAA